MAKPLKSINFPGIYEEYKLDYVKPLEEGGTGTGVDLVNAPKNAIIKKEGSGGAQLYYTATADGAFYATEANGVPKFGKLPIEQGGTFATTADEARANLKAPRIDLLWTNASPSSEFPSQTITVPGLSDYDMYIILARYTTDISSLVCGISKTGYGIRFASVGAGSATAPQEVIRTVDYSTGGKLKFYAATGFGNSRNDFFMPHFIYGIKGVQS